MEKSVFSLDFCFLKSLLNLKRDGINLKAKGNLNLKIKKKILKIHTEKEDLE